MMRYFFVWGFCHFLSLGLWAQQDLLNELAEEDKATYPVVATFKGERLVSLQTNEQLKKYHLNFNILHRFGGINTGVKDFFGLDYGEIRLLVEYGLTDKIQLSIGRSSLDKTYDAGLKLRLFQQQKGQKAFPLNITYYGNLGINTSSSDIFDYNGVWRGVLARSNFTNQLLISQKANAFISWLVAPTLVYYNLVDLKGQKNLSLFLGLGISAKISRSTRFNIEYYPRLFDRGSPDFSNQTTYDHLGVGFDIETGGHVFQFMFTNSKAMLEQQVLTQTTSAWSGQDFSLRLGFNISRTYSFEKTKY